MEKSAKPSFSFPFTDLEGLLTNPYRLFFPLAWVWGLYGVLLWTLAFLKDWDSYPYLEHGYVMFGGFFFNFILGFLLTAIPRFTQSAYASRKELLITVLFQLCFAISIFTGSHRGVYTFWFLQFLILILFAIKRFSSRNQNPPPSFLLLFLGLVLGGTGILLLALEAHMIFAKKLVYEAMLLGLVVGVGSRLLPGIFGWKDLLQHHQKLSEPRSSGVSLPPSTFVILASIFLLSFVFDFTHLSHLADLLRALLLAFVAVRFWRIYSLPKALTPHSFTLWLSCWCLVLGLGLQCLTPSLHARHISYIGGYALMTLMIASRVIVAHGLSDVQKFETRKSPFYWLGGLLLLLAFSRGTLHLFPEAYTRHILYYSLLWILCLALWGAYLLPRIWPKAKQS